MRKKGEKGAPKAGDFERAAQTAKEDAHTPLDRVKDAHAREKQQDKNRRDRELDRARLQTARQKNTQTHDPTSMKSGASAAPALPQGPSTTRSVAVRRSSRCL